MDAAGVARTKKQRGGYHGWAKERRGEDQPRCGPVKGRARAPLGRLPSRRCMGEFHEKDVL